MENFDRITWNPNQMNGQPCVRGMRMTVRRLVEAVSIYPNREDLFRNYPGYGDIAHLEYAASSIYHAFQTAVRRSVGPGAPAAFAITIAFPPV